MLRLSILSAAIVAAVAHATVSAETPPIHLGGPEIAKLDWGTRMMRDADFNGDGLRDLVFINADRASLDFLYQLAPGETKPAKPNIEPNRWEPVVEDARFRLHRVTTGDTMLELAVGDFNHDGLVDLAYTAENDPLVLRYQESPDEWKEIKPPLLPAASNLVGSLVADDVNGDGWADLVMATREEILVMHQTADGTLATADHYPLPDEGAEALQVLDIDRDGRPDLLYICRQNSLEPIRVRLQLPSGHFGPELRIEKKDIGTGLEYVGTMPGLASGAQNLTFLTTDFREGRIERVGLSVESAENADVDWVAPRVVKLKQAGRGTASYAFGDFDSDGYDDLAVSDPDASESTIYLREGEGNFAPPLRFPSLTDVKSLAAADANGNGRHELYLASSEESTVAWVEMDEAGRLNYPTPIAVGGRPLALAIGTTGKVSPILAVLETREKERWLEQFQHGEKGWSQLQETKIEDVRSTPENLAFWDADQDGTEDLLVFVPREPVRLYLRNGEDGSLTKVEAAAGFQRGLVDGLERSQVNFSDVDGDGHAELLILKDQYVRAVRLDEDHNFVVVTQFNNSDPSAGMATAIKLPAQSPTGEAVLLYDRKNGRFEVQRADDRGVYSTTDRHVADRLFVVDASVRSSRSTGGDADELFILGRDRFWWFPFAGQELTIESKVLFKSDLPDIAFSDVRLADLNADGTAELIGIDPYRNLIEIAEWAENDWRPYLHFKVFENAAPASPQASVALRQPREVLVTDITGDGLDDLLLLVHDRLLVYPQQLVE